MSDDLISRKAANDAMAQLQAGAYSKAEFKAIMKAWKRIKKLPPAQPERMRGYWVPQDFNKQNGNTSTCVYYFPKCSVCGHVGDESFAFCPNCGADMRIRGEQDG